MEQHSRDCVLVMSIYLCIDMCVEMCVEMCVDMCVGSYAKRSPEDCTLVVNLLNKCRLAK